MKDVSKNTGIIISTDGRMIPVKTDESRGFQLKELQGIVGGLIDILPYKGDDILVINDNGRYTCEPNPAATIMARQAGVIPEWDFIFGTILFCNTNLVK